MTIFKRKTQDPATKLSERDWRIIDDMRKAIPIPANEDERMQVLRTLSILDTHPEEQFDRITRVASRTFNVPMALVSLVDVDRQWFKSRVGLDATETDREVAFCAHAICPNPTFTNADILYVPDATKDDRFSSNPLVAGDFHLRFYVGVPLHVPVPGTSRTVSVGTLCCLDLEPREFSESDMNYLRDLGSMVVDQLSSRFNNIQSTLEAKQDFITSTAHDLKTPLSSFQLSLDMLAQTKVTSKQKALLDQASVSLKLMNHTIASAMALAKSWHSGSGPEAVSFPMDVIDLMKDTEKVMDAYPKKVPITYDVDPDTPQIINSDRTMVWQGVINLLSNACKNTEKGSIHVKVLPYRAPAAKPALSTPNATPFTNETGVRFEVVDTGKGVSDELAEKLFAEKFVQGESNVEGTGFGLYGVRKTASLLSGNCGVYDNPKGQGSVFWLEIPSTPLSSVQHCAALPANPEQWPVASPTTKRRLENLSVSVDESPSQKRRTQLSESVLVDDETVDDNVSLTTGTTSFPRPRSALVVEDSPTTRTVLGKALEGMGLEVEVADSAEEALEKMKSQSWGLVITDNNFGPGCMTGLEMVSTFRDHEVETGASDRQFIVCLSGSATDTLFKKKSLGVDVDHVFAKPVKLGSLRSLVDQLEFQEE